MSHIALAENYYRIDKGKVDIIPPGVEMEFLNKNKTLKINNLLKVVFYNGNNDFIDRGLDEMLEALKNPDFPMRLYIIGNKINIKDVGIDVEFVSPMKKYGLKNFLADKHILIKSSSFDSFSIFSIECMATGLIVVLSNKVGSAIYIKNGENGFVYDYSEPESVKDIFKDIYFHKYNLEAISKKAQEIVNELGWEIISKKYINCYRELL